MKKTCNTSCDELKNALKNALEKTNRTLYTTFQIHRLLIRAKSQNELLNNICEILVKNGGYKMAMVRYWNETQDEVIASYNAPTAFLKKISQHKGTCCCEFPKTRITKMGFLYHKNANELKNKNCREILNKFGYKSLISFPLYHEKNMIGALTIFSNQENSFVEKESELLGALSNDISHGITSIHIKKEKELADARLIAETKKLHTVLIEIIEAIGKSMEKRDPYTSGHQHQVADLAVAIAKELKLSSIEIESLRLAALIHDIGKMYIPVEILTRPAKLTEKEFELIKAHPQAGYDIIKDIEFEHPIQEIMLNHHERLNGSGYPRKLKNGEIGILSRILAIADVVEAMSSHRPYRPALSIKKALHEIKKNAGILYDKAAVEACIRIFKEKRFSF